MQSPQTATLVDVSCPQCGETYHVKEEHLGKNLKCRRCDTVFELRGGPGGRAPGRAEGSEPATGARGSGAGEWARAGGGGAPRGPAPGQRPPEAAVAHPIAVTDADFARTVLQSTQPVLVDFWAPWCAPCRALAPALEQLAAEYAGRVTIAKLNTDENQRTMVQAGVQGLPTLVLYKGGKEVDRLVGLRPKPHIKQALDRALA
ncbi:MAG TPA: thioredoxin [Chloroflexota bacterium]|nr:thioredoxin [Chloroflexota bacterium]